MQAFLGAGVEEASDEHFRIVSFLWKYCEDCVKSRMQGEAAKAWHVARGAGDGGTKGVWVCPRHL